MKAPLPNNEADRLAILRSYVVLDTASEQAYDDLTLLAAQICQTPTALVSLIDENRQWFKSKVGLSVAETSRDFSFCAHAILEPDKVLEIRDALLDPRFSDNPLVTGDPHIRFYAGAPLVTADGLALGTLSVIDYQPRALSEIQRITLRALSRHVVTLLELRRGVNELMHAEAALRESEERLEHKVEERTQALLEKERRLRIMIETQPECVKIVDASGRLCEMNAAGLAMLEAESLSQVQQHLLLNFILPEYKDTFRALHKRVMEGETGKLEFEVLGLKGTRRWLETHAAPIRDSSGAVTSLLGITRDITETKRVEREIRERERQLFTLIGNLPGVAYRCRNDPDYTVEFISDSIEKLTGYPADDFTHNRRQFGQMIHPSDQARVWQDIQAALQQNLPFELTYRFLTASGTERWAWEKGQGIKDDHGNLVALEGFVTDITERKQAEAQLVLAAKVFEQSNEAFMVTDAYRNIVMVNPAFTTITGYSEAEALGKSPRLLYSGKQDQDFYRAMWEAINTLGHWQGEILDRRKDGSIYPKWLSISRVHDSQGTVSHYIGIFSDITQHKKNEAHIQKLAHFDALTELPNRVLLNDRITLALSAAQRNRTSLAVMFVDLDHFKNVNDTLGHRIGDALLIEVAKRMKTVVREDDTVSRLGGDEFIFVLPGSDVDGAAHVAEKLLETVAQRYMIEQYELVITPSIGIAIYPNDGENFEALSQCADIAMYRAKRDGRNTYRFFTPEMQASSVRTLQLENALHHALDRDELYLHYQPQISLQDGRIIGAEALLRWRHPEFGMVSPAEFIPIVEDSGQILQIGEWVLRTAVRQLKTWIDNGMAPMTMAVNLSVVQFRHLNLPDMVSQILAEAQLPPKYLELELTEGVAMEDPLGAIAVMDKLHQRGIRISLDDFGTGYSSLNYLKRFKIYKLKIDQSFVRDITIDPDDKAIVSAVISMASSLGMLTIAEGVETEGQLDYLREQGCNEVQGYFFCHPLPADQLEVFIKNTRPVSKGRKKK